MSSVTLPFLNLHVSQQKRKWSFLLHVVFLLGLWQYVCMPLMARLGGGQGVDVERVGVWSYTVRVPTLVLLAMKPWTLPSSHVEPPAQLHQWPSLPPCLTDLAHFVIGIMLETHPGVFLPWLCSFSLFLCFLFFLTHYVATFPSCVLCVSPISAFPSSSLCLGSPSSLHFSLPLPAPCPLPSPLVISSSHSPAVTCRQVPHGGQGHRLWSQAAWYISFLSPLVTGGGRRGAGCDLGTSCFNFLCLSIFIVKTGIRMWPSSNS